MPGILETLPHAPSFPFADLALYPLAVMHLSCMLSPVGPPSKSHTWEYLRDTPITTQALFFTMPFGISWVTGVLQHTM